MGCAVREPLSVVIFGDGDDEKLIRLKCMLLKSGICNFVKGCAEKCGEQQAGLFIVACDSLTSSEVESIQHAAHRLAVPVLRL